jgi:hypothetical protein
MITRIKTYLVSNMGVWQGVAIESLSMARAHHALPFYTLQAGHPVTASWPFQGWPAQKAGALRPSSTHLDTPRRTPLVLHRENHFYN